jgi:excinuclease UvrABC nuclease subunit
MEWLQFDLDAPPSEPGIYAIKAGDRWLYVGRSGDVAKRIQQKRHPAQITRGLTSLSLSYWWSPCTHRQARVEHRLIAELEPEWNGSTTYDTAPPYWQWATDKHGNVLDVRVQGGAQGPRCLWMGWVTDEMVAAALALI